MFDHILTISDNLMTINEAQQMTVQPNDYWMTNSDKTLKSIKTPLSSMKKVLVTGAIGFIGFHLTERLLKESYSVVGIDNINNYYDVNLKYSRLQESGIPRNKIKDNAG